MSPFPAGKISLPSTGTESTETKDEGRSLTAETGKPALVVLLVDDHDGVRGVTRRLLEREGFDVLEAASGEEALGMARSAPSIDLLLTDVVMPGMAGPDLAARMVGEELVSRVVVYSAYSPKGGEVAPDGVQHWTFLSKPFSRAQLSAALAEVLS